MARLQKLGTRFPGVKDLGSSSKITILQIANLL